MNEDERIILVLTRAETGLVQSLARQAIKRHAKNRRTLEQKFGEGTSYQSGRAAALKSLHDKAAEGLGRHVKEEER